VDNLVDARHGSTGFATATPTATPIPCAGPIGNRRRAPVRMPTGRRPDRGPPRRNVRQFVAV